MREVLQRSLCHSSSSAASSSSSVSLSLLLPPNPVKLNKPVRKVVRPVDSPLCLEADVEQFPVNTQKIYTLKRKNKHSITQINTKNSENKSDNQQKVISHWEGWKRRMNDQWVCLFHTDVLGVKVESLRMES